MTEEMFEFGGIVQFCGHVAEFEKLSSLLLFVATAGHIFPRAYVGPKGQYRWEPQSLHAA